MIAANPKLADEVESPVISQTDGTAPSPLNAPEAALEPDFFALTKTMITTTRTEKTVQGKPDALVAFLRSSQDTQRALLERLEGVQATLVAQGTQLQTLMEQVKQLQDRGGKRELDSGPTRQRISMAGIDKVTKLQFQLRSGRKLDEWRKSLYLHVADCPLAVRHLRSEEHDADDSGPRTARYDVELDRELAMLIYQTVEGSLQCQLELAPFKGSVLMKKVEQLLAYRIPF
ncbi:hypothetical protein OC842_003887 [Tilletia horrida]|uniref:Uncharacterized protein n=1 Tax=Tilletia horrida TaxID=155126 RepID=A0AAN6GCS5_9BASI|nr:hypothetical protein OC842_003887 [Tilletia horrida]